MSLGWVETEKPTTSRMPTGLIITGIILAAVGGIIMGVVNKRKTALEDVQQLRDAMLGWEYVPGETIQTLVVWGYFGLGVLIFGALLALIGVAAMAMRR